MPRIRTRLLEKNSNSQTGLMLMCSPILPTSNVWKLKRIHVCTVSIVQGKALGLGLFFVETFRKHSAGQWALTVPTTVLLSWVGETSLFGGNKMY